MRPRYYILGADNVPVPVGDELVFVLWVVDRWGPKTLLLDEGPGEHVWVSTIFLGRDHRHVGDGPPILFETVVVSDGEPTDEMRHCTYAEAEAYHHEMVVKHLPPEPVKPPVLRLWITRRMDLG